jgi:Skp family chaperone for outer membrane proteins
LKSKPTYSIGISIAAGLLLFGVAAGRRGHADEPQPPTIQMTQVAVVDMNRLYDMSGAPAEYERNGLSVMQDAEQRMKTLLAADYLEGVEIQEYIMLVGRFAPTPEQTKRMTALKDLSDKRAIEMRELQTKDQSAMTAQDKKRLSQLLNANRIYREREMPSVESQLRNLAIARTQSFRDEQVKRLRVLVGKYARDKGIQHVFDNTALIYSPNDITDKVIEKVKKP